MKNKHSTDSTLLLLIIRDILAPILNAVVETGGIRPSKDCDNAQIFSQLLEIIGTLQQNLTQKFGPQINADNEEVSHKLLTTLASLVATYYRSTGSVPSIDGMEKQFAILLDGAKRMESFIESGHTEETMAEPTQIDIVHYMTPVTAAICRFAFGKPENDVLTEVIEKIRLRALEMSRDLADPGQSEDEQHRLILLLLKPLASLYAESHYAEMDRLLDMSPDDRSKYVVSWDNKPPMEPVWIAFQLRSSLLVTVAKQSLSSYQY